MNLSVETSLALLYQLDEYIAADFDALGITEKDFQQVSQHAPWRRDLLSPVMRTMNAILFGTLELMGMQKIVVPSEYVAAVVVGIVAPPNRMTACIWLATERQTGTGALEQSARAQSTSQLDPTSADQLFALVCLLSANEKSGEVRQRMLRKLGLAQDKALEKELSPK